VAREKKEEWLLNQKNETSPKTLFTFVAAPSTSTWAAFLAKMELCDGIAG
jgi:hypothetical protein